MIDNISVYKTFFVQEVHEYYDENHVKMVKCYLLNDKFTVLKENISYNNTKTYTITNMSKIHNEIDNTEKLFNKKKEGI